MGSTTGAVMTPTVMTPTVMASTVRLTTHHPAAMTQAQHPPGCDDDRFFDGAYDGEQTGITGLGLGLGLEVRVRC